MSSPSAAGVSEVYAAEGESWRRVSPGHSISERRLQECAPDLYAQWWAAPSATQPDQVALTIYRCLDELEAAPTGREGAAATSDRDSSGLTQGVTRYEDQAERLGAIALDDPGRPTKHLHFQSEGDRLRDAVAARPTGEQSELLVRRLETADLAAVRPVVQAVSGYTVQVDRIALYGSTAHQQGSEQ